MAINPDVSSEINQDLSSEIHQDDLFSKINQDLLSEILSKLEDPFEHISCCSTSRSWRLAAMPHRCNLPDSIPAIMVALTTLPKRRIIAISDQFRHSDKHFLDVYRHETCCGSYKGWLVLTSEKRGLMSIFLHNPFAKRRRLLPDLSNKVYKAVLSSSPSFDSMCKVLLLLQSGGAALCTVGDKSWKFFSTEPCAAEFSDALYYEERFYVVDDDGKIYVCNLDNMVLIQFESQPSFVMPKLKRLKWYLVDIKGQLSVVLRIFSWYYPQHYGTDNYNDCSRVSTREFRVWRMNSGTNEWVLVSTLVGSALFLGGSNSVSVGIKLERTVRGNSVYFTDDRQIKHFGMNGINNPGKDMGIYNMTDMSIRPLYSDPRCELTDHHAAIWVMPLPW